MSEHNGMILEIKFPRLSRNLGKFTNVEIYVSEKSQFKEEIKWD